MFIQVSESAGRGFGSLLIAAAILATAPCAASAQTITDGNSTFGMPDATTTGATVRTGTTGGTGTGAIFTAGGDTTDQLFQQWWWYRVNGVNTREFALSGRTSSVAAGNTHTLTFTEPEGFNAQLRYKITDGPDSPASANVGATLNITNTTASPMDIAVFCYLDYDLEGAGSDSATLVEPGRIQITDTTGFAGQFLGVNADLYEVTTFSTVRGKLADTLMQNLTGTGLPFSPADFTGAFQWNLNIPAGASRTVRAAFSLNMPASVGCAADFNGDGSATVQDIFDFLVAYFSNLLSADVNNSGSVTVQDIFDFLVAYFAGCP